MDFLDTMACDVIIIPKEIALFAFSLTPSGEATKRLGIGTLCSRIRCHQGPDTLLAFFFCHTHIPTK